VSPDDPDAWLELLMARDQALAVRVMEVRRSYAREQFEYGSLERLAKRGAEEGNLRVMRAQAARSLARGAGGGGGGGGGGGSCVHEKGGVCVCYVCVCVFVMFVCVFAMLVCMGMLLRLSLVE